MSGEVWEIGQNWARAGMRSKEGAPVAQNLSEGLGGGTNPLLVSIYSD